MIQRIQSLWLLLVAICAFVSYTLTLYIGKLADGSDKIFLVAGNIMLVIFIIAIGLLALISIFLFKNRKIQFRLSIFGIILSFLFLIVEYFKVEEFIKANNIVSGSYQILALLLPMMMIVFFILAARGIYKDEKLVKSLDRLR